MRDMPPLALVRSVYRRRVRWAFTHRVVGEDGGRLALYLALGTPGVLMRRNAGERYLESWVRGDPPSHHLWQRTHMLDLVRPADSHALRLFWDDRWEFLGWYVNLQAPLRRTVLGYDTTDWALDISVEPDGTWSWKDEADFAEAQALGVLDASAAERVRSEGERVVRRRPWPTGWEDWRPDPAWPIPPLPPDWDVV